MANREIVRGELWWVNWSPGRGSEQIGRRPALIVQTDAANRNPRYPNTIVVAVSTRGKDVPFHIGLEPSRQNGLSEPSFAKCEQVLTISKDRIEGRIGRVGRSDVQRVEAAIKLVLAL